MSPNNTGQQDVIWKGSTHQDLELSKCFQSRLSTYFHHERSLRRSNIGATSTLRKDH